MTIDEANYKKVSALVDEWLDLHTDETFDLDTICRQLEIRERPNRHNVVKKLFYEVKRKKLEKSNRIYRYIDNNIKYIDWVNADANQSIKINFPYGVDDNSQFGFDGRVVICPGDIIVIAGTSNMGKTTFCLNFLWENMDYFPCTLMGQEYTPVKFKRRVSHMTWKEPINGGGNPKFELIERRENWHDIIRPDNINIIDWISLDDKFWQIGNIIDKIQSKLNKGIALISIQKSSQKTIGLGGEFGVHLASLYITIDYERMTVVKAKEWYDHNPNNEMYGFTIVNYGTKFHNIRIVKTCPKCYGKNPKCPVCNGKGYIDKE